MWAKFTCSAPYCSFFRILFTSHWTKSDNARDNLLAKLIWTFGVLPLSFFNYLNHLGYSWILKQLFLVWLVALQWSHILSSFLLESFLLFPWPRPYPPWLALTSITLLSKFSNKKICLDTSLFLYLTIEYALLTEGKGSMTRIWFLTLS